MLPTPTPLPPAVQQVTLNPDGYRLWSFTDEALQIWNYEPNLGLVVQLMIVVVLVIIFVVLLIRLIQGIMSER